MVDTAVLFGANQTDAERDMYQVLQLETRIANASITKKKNLLLRIDFRNIENIIIVKKNFGIINIYTRNIRVRTRNSQFMLCGVQLSQPFELILTE